MPLISASTVSLETQASWVLWLQLIFEGLAETDPLTGATTTVALAMPAVKRGADLGRSHEGDILGTPSRVPSA